MAITKNDLTSTDTQTSHGWTVNAYSADLTGTETLKAAPGAGFRLVVERIFISTDSAVTVTIGEDESGGAVGSTLFGPIPCGSQETLMLWLLRPVVLSEDTALTADASGAGDVCLVVEGRTEPV